MKKIVSLFQRNYDGDGKVRDEIVPGAEWVAAGEGTATRKFDGTCCLVRGGSLFKRFEVKPGGSPPPHFETANEVDPTTGKQQGWLPITDGAEDQWHRAAFEATKKTGPVPDGTYELCGPKIQGNPEGFDTHVLVPHGKHPLPDAPRTFALIREYLAARSIEGIVWHHPDGRMVKIKRKDFAK
jgi:hypothetical protein